MNKRTYSIGKSEFVEVFLSIRAIIVHGFEALPTLVLVLAVILGLITS